MVVAVSPGAGSGQRGGGGGQRSSAPSQRTDSTLPQRVKLPSGVQRYPPRPIHLPHLRTRSRTWRRRALPHRQSANPKPNPAAACASAPPVCEPEAEPGSGVRFRTAGLRTRSRTRTRRWRAFLHRQSPNPKPTSCGGGGASLSGDLCKSALRVSGCSLAGRQAKLLLTSTHWPWPSGSAGAASRGRPPRMPATPTVQPAPSRRCSLGGAPVEDRIVVKYIHL
jgi:hypothetical protein